MLKYDATKAMLSTSLALEGPAEDEAKKHLFHRVPDVIEMPVSRKFRLEVLKVQLGRYYQLLYNTLQTITNLLTKRPINNDQALELISIAEPLTVQAIGSIERANVRDIQPPRA